MNKDEYQERSRRLRLPQRCPLIGYCQRWAWSVYFYSYRHCPNPTDDIGDVLKSDAVLPDDYDASKVLLLTEAPEMYEFPDFFGAHNLCPEIPLFDRRNTLGFLPREAISSFSLDKEERDLDGVEHKHFSECLEFIRWHEIAATKVRRRSVSQKLRFEILNRDNFKCVYCGRSADCEGVVLHVDHRQSVRDGGATSPDNLVTACSDCNLGKSGDSIYA